MPFAKYLKTLSLLLAVTVFEINTAPWVPAPLRFNVVTQIAVSLLVGLALIMWLILGGKRAVSKERNDG